MASVVISGDTSGTVTLAAPAVSGTTTLTLPTTSGTVVADTATQTLTNKTLTSPTIATPTITGQATIPTINLTGGQITFPATQNPSADANTLDDYEEGSWTPNVGGSATYTVQTGSYVKIGKLVLVRGNLKINIIGTGSTNTISGLPFTGGGDEYTIPVDKSEGLSVSIVSMALRTSGATLYANYRTTASASSNINGNFLQNSTEMQFTGCYIATA